MAETETTSSGRVMPGSVDRYTRIKNTSNESDTADRNKGRGTKRYLRNARRFEKSRKLIPGLNLRKGMRRVRALATTGWIISWTWPLYIVQLIAFMFWFIGLGTGISGEETWLGWIVDGTTGLVSDTAEIFIYLGMGLGLIAVTLGLLVANVLYLSRRVPTFSASSLIVMAVMISFALTPVVVLPLVWVWCLNVIIGQKE